MKYRLVNRRDDGLYQIEALREGPWGLVGTLGGWVETEDNLSQEGDCWVYGSAQVCGEARVFGEARVYDSALVSGEAWVYGEARVYGSAQVSGWAQVYGSAQVYDSVEVSGEAQVSGSARVYGKAKCTKTPVVITGLPRHNIVMTDGQLVSIGCEQYPLEHWLEHYKEIGTKHNYTEEEIEACGKILKGLA